MAYTEEGIMAQIWIAFGQGAGAIRVSEEAALYFRRRYLNEMTPQVLAQEWETQAVQLLNRIRAIGSLAASKAASVGARAITPKEIIEIYESAPALLETAGCDAEIAEIEGKARLRAAVATNPAWGAEISNLELLDDAALWNAAQTRMSQLDSEGMEELHRKQRVTGLSEVEAEELARLQEQYERVILVRSHSASLLEKRGHDIRSLTSGDETRRLAPGG